MHQNWYFSTTKDKYGDMARLLFTDTDSLMYEIETQDLYEDITPDIEEWFDTSEFQQDHPSGLPTGINKKVLGKMKDEAGGKIITEFVGLRAKLYSYKVYEDPSEYKKCKGIKKKVVKRCIKHEDYKKCLNTGEEQSASMNLIRSHDHNLYSEEVNKISLSANDDKRALLKGTHDTLAHGHWRLNSLKTSD